MGKNNNTANKDPLINMLNAATKNDDHLSELAKRFEDLKQDWPIEHARSIYKKIGNHEKYLELRSLKMHYGADYYDLASFYWGIGEKEKAINTAKKGMDLAEGRMDELRMFLAERAKEAGDRETYLKYYFSQKTGCLTLTSYKELEEECRKEEWEKYEAKILDLLKKDFNIQAVKIHLYRKEYEKALQYFKAHSGSAYYFSGDSGVFSVAKELEARYPTQILSFYKLSIGNLNVSASRKVYSQNAEAVARVRRVLVDVMKRPDEWKKFALPIKLKNIKRPAFQEEFSRIIPDWYNL